MEKNLKIKFLLLLLGSIIFCISYGGGQDDFFSILLNSYSYSATIIVLMSVLIYNVIDIIKDFNDNYLYLCRLKNMKMYYKKIILECIKSNLKILIIFFLLVISASIIACCNNYSIPENFYDINFIIILIYYTLKFIIICILFSIISVFMYILYKYFGIAIFSVIIILCPLINSFEEGSIISEINSFPINYIKYLSFNQYATFFHDIIAFTLYVSIILIIISTFNYIALKKKGDIVE